MFWGISALQMEYNNSAYVLPRATVMLYCFTCGWNVNLLLYKINACMEGVTCLLRLVFILLNSCLFFFGIGILTKMELWAMSYAWYQNFICSKFQNAILLQFAFLNFFFTGLCNFCSKAFTCSYPHQNCVPWQINWKWKGYGRFSITKVFMEKCCWISKDLFP